MDLVVASSSPQILGWALLEAFTSDTFVVSLGMVSLEPFTVAWPPFRPF